MNYFLLFCFKHSWKSINIEDPNLCYREFSLITLIYSTHNSGFLSSVWVFETKIKWYMKNGHSNTGTWTTVVWCLSNIKLYMKDRYSNSGTGTTIVWYLSNIKWCMKDGYSNKRTGITVVWCLANIIIET